MIYQIDTDFKDSDRIKLNKNIQHSASLKGKKLLTSNANKIKLLKFNKKKRDQIKMEMSLCSIEVLQQSPEKFPKLITNIVKSIEKQIEKKQVERNKSYEEKKKQLMEKRRKMGVQSKAKNMGRVSQLLTQLKNHYNSQRELDRTIERVKNSGRESALLNPDKTQLTYRKNSFFKSHKSQIYIKSKAKVLESNFPTSRTNVQISNNENQNKNKIKSRNFQTLEPINPEDLTFGIKPII